MLRTASHCKRDLLCILLGLPSLLGLMSDVCGQVGADSGAAAAAWFTQALGVACWLVQQRPGSRAAVAPKRSLNMEGRPSGEGPQEVAPGIGAAANAPALAASCTNASIGMGPGLCPPDSLSITNLLGGTEEQISGALSNACFSTSRIVRSYVQCAAGFANEGQFLLASEASLAHLNARLQLAPGQAPIDMARFRPNLVVGGGGLAPFAEDAWHSLALGAARFRVVGAHANGRLLGF